MLRAKREKKEEGSEGKAKAIKKGRMKEKLHERTLGRSCPVIGKKKGRGKEAYA